MVRGSTGSAYLGFIGGIVLALIFILIGSSIERAIDGGETAHAEHAEP